MLAGPTVLVKTLQRIVGKCVSLSLAFPAAPLFTKEMNVVVRWGVRYSRPVSLSDPLRWLFLKTLTLVIS